MDKFKVAARQLNRAVNQANLPSEQHHMLSDFAPIDQPNPTSMHYTTKTLAFHVKINHINRSIHMK